MKNINIFNWSSVLHVLGLLIHILIHVIGWNVLPLTIVITTIEVILVIISLSRRR